MVFSSGRKERIFRQKRSLIREYPKFSNRKDLKRNGQCCSVIMKAFYITWDVNVLNFRIQNRFGMFMMMYSIKRHLLYFLSLSKPAEWCHLGCPPNDVRSQIWHTAYDDIIDERLFRARSFCQELIYLEISKRIILCWFCL